MKILSISPVITTRTNRKQFQKLEEPSIPTPQNDKISFKGLFDYYDYATVMKAMSIDGYIIKGRSNKEAFGKFYDEVLSLLEKIVRSGKGGWSHTKNRPPELAPVHYPPINKKLFIELATEYYKFYEAEASNYLLTSSVVDDFLINKRNLVRPNLIEFFTEVPNAFQKQRGMLIEMTKQFLNTGQYKLR